MIFTLLQSVENLDRALLWSRHVECCGTDDSCRNTVPNHNTIMCELQIVYVM